MVSELVGFAFSLFVAVTVVALGSYIGALPALETYHSGEDSIFLSDDADLNE